MAQFVYPNNINFEISLTQMPSNQDYVRLIAQSVMIPISVMIIGDYTSEQRTNLGIMINHCGICTIHSTSDWLQRVNAWAASGDTYDEIMYHLWQFSGGYKKPEQEPEWFNDETKGDFIRIEESIF